MSPELTKADKTLSLWKSYEYIGPEDKFHDVHFETHGGQKDNPYIWADDNLWSIDTPESPHSILALVFYRHTNYLSPIDLRDATVQFYLRGDELNLSNAKCYFWVTTIFPVTRWHYIHHPIEISNGKWGDLMTLNLSNSSTQWHQSFSTDPSNAHSLNQTLRVCISYGFSFVGFQQKVTGKLSMSDFNITRKNTDSSWPFVANLIENYSNWQTVNRIEKKQVAIEYGLIHRYLSCLNRITQVVFINDNYLKIPNTIPFAYIAFISSEYSTKNSDLRNALVIVIHTTENFNPNGGTTHFFIEHTKSNTIWIYNDSIEHRNDSATRFILRSGNNYWFRLTGSLDLDSMLSGNSGTAGYDYLGFMAVGISDHPSGTWGLVHLSIGPNFEKAKLQTV